MVVDDHVDSREALVHLLTVWGHEVVAAEDGIVALHEYDEFNPDIMIIDLDLPGIRGEKVVSAIRARGSKAFIIALTGWSLSEYRERATEAGCDVFLLKPCDLEELHDLVALRQVTRVTPPRGKRGA
jgi:DNA-binding response OmpR family regulator